MSTFLNVVGQIRQYVEDIDARPLSQLGIDEEYAPDLRVGTFVPETRAEPIWIFDDINKDPYSTSVDFSFFVDGTQSVVIYAEKIIGSYRVPIHAFQVSAGAVKRKDRRLEPHVITGPHVIIALPFRAMKEIDNSLPPPPGVELATQPSFYETIAQEASPLWIDTSVSLLRRRGIDGSLEEEGLENDLRSSDLVKVGELRQLARNKASIIRRILELGVVNEIRRNWPNEFVILDGPIAPILKYASLVSQNMSGLKDLANRNFAYDFLGKLIGVVKEVQIVPDKGLSHCFSRGSNPKEQNLSIPTYIMGETIKGTDRVGRATLSAYCWLRPEISNEYTAVWSGISGLCRFDIPFPIFCGKDERWDEPDFKPNFSDETVRNKLKVILESLVKERWPIPPAYGQRLLVEFYPIFEVERWLRSNLLSHLEFARI